MSNPSAYLHNFRTTPGNSVRKSLGGREIESQTGRRVTQVSRRATEREAHWGPPGVRSNSTEVCHCIELGRQREASESCVYDEQANSCAPAHDGTSRLDEDRFNIGAREPADGGHSWRVPSGTAQHNRAPVDAPSRRGAGPRAGGTGRHWLPAGRGERTRTRRLAHAPVEQLVGAPRLGALTSRGFVSVGA